MHQVGIRAQTHELYGKIIEDYYEGPLSVKALKKKHGRSESSINKALEKYKRAYLAEHGTERVRVGKPRDPRVEVGKKSLTGRHAHIGLAIGLYMNQHQLSPTAFGHLISKSRVDVRDMCIGCYDLTLCDVERIATVVGQPLDQLLNPKGAQIYVAA